MALVFDNAVREVDQSTTPATDDFLLDATDVVSGHQGFDAAGIANNDTVYYEAQQVSAGAVIHREVGIGTWNDTAKTLSRSPIWSTAGAATKAGFTLNPNVLVTVAAEAFTSFSQDKAGFVPGPTASDISSGLFLKADGTWAAAAGGGAITALNNATENELVTVGATTTELDAEANLTWDGAGVLSVHRGDSGELAQLNFGPTATRTWQLIGHGFNDFDAGNHGSYALQLTNSLGGNTGEFVITPIVNFQTDITADNAGGTVSLTWDASGLSNVGTLSVGDTSGGGTTPSTRLQVFGTSADTASIGQRRVSADLYGPYQYYEKARGTVGAEADANSSDLLGGFIFRPWVTSDYATRAAMQGYMSDATNGGIAFATGVTSIPNIGAFNIRMHSDGDMDLLDGSLSITETDTGAIPLSVTSAASPATKIVNVNDGTNDIFWLDSDREMNVRGGSFLVSHSTSVVPLIVQSQAAHNADYLQVTQNGVKHWWINSSEQLVHNAGGSEGSLLGNAKLKMSSDSAFDAFNAHAAISSSTQRAGIGVIKSRGTVASPVAVQDNDSIGFIGFKGYDGGTTQLTGIIEAFCDGTPVANTSCPIRLSFVTGTAGGNRAETLRINSDNTVTIPDGSLSITETDTGATPLTVTSAASATVPALLFDGATPAAAPIHFQTSWDNGLGFLIPFQQRDSAGTDRSLIGLSDDATPDVLLNAAGSGDFIFINGGAKANKIVSVENAGDVSIHTAGAAIDFAGTAGGGNEKITYKDSGGTQRNALAFPGSNVVSIQNRAANGNVEINANSTAGAGGEVTIGTFSASGTAACALTTSITDDNVLTVTSASNPSATTLLVNAAGTPTTNPIVDFQVGGTSSFAIEPDSYSGTYLFGNGTTIRSLSGANRKFYIETNHEGPLASIGCILNANQTWGPSIILAKSRGSSMGSNAIVQDGDSCGAIQFIGADGTDLNNSVAQISAKVDGTPGANDTPGRLEFRTTPDGSGSTTERMRIDSAGLTTFTVDALGNSQVDTSGVALRNTTAAVANVSGDDGQEYSPALRWEGQGWKTDATAASQSVEFRSWVRPVQGTAAPTSDWVLGNSINGGAYSERLIVSDTLGYTSLQVGDLIIKSNTATVSSLSASGGNNYLRLVSGLGSKTNVNVGINADDNTGLFSDTANHLSGSASGAEFWRCDPTGTDIFYIYKETNITADADTNALSVTSISNPSATVLVVNGAGTPTGNIAEFQVGGTNTTYVTSSGQLRVTAVADPQIVIRNDSSSWAGSIRLGTANYLDITKTATGRVDFKTIQTAGAFRFLNNTSTQIFDIASNGDVTVSGSITGITTFSSAKHTINDATQEQIHAYGWANGSASNWAGHIRLANGAGREYDIFKTSGGVVNHRIDEAAGNFSFSCNAGSTVLATLNSSGSTLVSDLTITGDINPEADGTRDLGTQTTAQWANVWSDLINGAEISLENSWRIMESELYVDYPQGFAIGHSEHWETGKSIYHADDDNKRRYMSGQLPTFAVTDNWIEFRGRRITVEQWDKLVKLLEQN